MLDKSVDFKCYEISLFENRKYQVVWKVLNMYLITFNQYRTLTVAELNEIDVDIRNIRRQYQDHEYIKECNKLPTTISLRKFKFFSCSRGVNALLKAPNIAAGHCLTNLTK